MFVLLAPTAYRAAPVSTVHSVVLQNIVQTVGTLKYLVALKAGHTTSLLKMRDI